MSAAFYARAPFIMHKQQLVPNYTIGGPVTPQREGVRRPAVAQIAATIMDQHTQQSAGPQGAIRKGHHPRTADDV